MKYARLRYKWEHSRVNLGDDIQQIAVDYLYECMGLLDENIVELQFSDLGKYDGEDIVLPICFPFHSYREFDYFTCFSDRITPVFLNLSLYGTSLSEADVKYLRKYEPIGCRDMMTYRLMKKYNICAYCNGCVTMLLPRRDCSGKDIFAVDVESEVVDEILLRLHRDSSKVIYTTHELLNVPGVFNTYQAASDILKMYSEKASLVITSRMHCALPCAAMGIPVFFCGKDRSHRFEGVDSIVPFYTRSELMFASDDIQPVFYDEIKKEIIDLDIKRLCFGSISDIDYERIHSIFAAEEKKEYKVDIISDFIEYADGIALEGAEYHYYLWGITPIARALYDYISIYHPNAKLMGIIDKKKRMVFCGKESRPIEEVGIDLQSVWFVCSRNANDEALDFFRQNNINNYCMQGVY